MSNFNRREDFLTEITEKYKELDANVLDLSIPEIIDCHIEMNDIEIIEKIEDVKDYRLHDLQDF